MDGGTALAKVLASGERSFKKEIEKLLLSDGDTFMVKVFSQSPRHSFNQVFRMSEVIPAHQCPILLMS